MVRLLFALLLSLQILVLVVFSALLLGHLGFPPYPLQSKLLANVFKVARDCCIAKRKHFIWREHIISLFAYLGMRAYS